MNEVLCRALLQARLSDEDVAARLEVDPKTVRRWLDGRVPYLRHRWALALLVGIDESDLWPQLQATRPRPSEVVTIYPHRDSIPPETWLRLFGSARQEIGALADSEFLLADGPAILEVLAERARSGVKVRICLADPTESADVVPGVGTDVAETPYGEIREAVRLADFRLHGVRDYNSISYADDDIIVIQHIYGLPVGRAPALRLRRVPGGDMVPAYLSSFERIWANARRIG